MLTHRGPQGPHNEENKMTERYTIEYENTATGRWPVAQYTPVEDETITGDGDSIAERFIRECNRVAGCAWLGGISADGAWYREVFPHYRHLVAHDIDTFDGCAGHAREIVFADGSVVRYDSAWSGPLLDLHRGVRYTDVVRL